MVWVVVLIVCVDALGRSTTNARAVKRRLQGQRDKYDMLEEKGKVLHEDAEFITLAKRGCPLHMSIYQMT
jgi:hypothetical protein